MKIKQQSIRKRIGKAAMWLALPATMGLFSCSENIDEANLYTFTGETIEDYLQTRPDQFSSFNYILERVGYDKIMSAYGTYTCFAPDNKAVSAYIDSLYNDTADVRNVWTVGKDRITGHNGMTAAGLEGLTDSLCRDIALIHLLYSKVLSADMAKDASFSTLLNREINTTVGSNAETIVNSYSIVDPENMDVELENGVLHHIDHVITRSNNLVLAELGRHENYTLFTDALKACGLEDILSESRREGIQMPTIAGTGKGAGKIYTPEECLVGFTVFAESNEVLKSNNINSVESLAEYAKRVYEHSADAVGGWYDYYRNNNIKVSTGKDYDNPNNVLNMFLRYHIVKYKVPYSKLVNSYNEVSQVQLYEYYETMLPYTLLKVCQTGGNLYVNRWQANSTLTDGVAVLGQGQEFQEIKRTGLIIDRGTQIDALNGYIHPISGMLVYDKDVPGGVLKERMRFDDISLLPEMMTNGLRRIDAATVKTLNGGEGSGTFGGDDAVRLPINYCEHLVIYNGDNTQLFYLPGQAVGWSNYQGDELLCMGPYDFAFRLPPVPDGMYELRMGYTANGNRGMVQIYLGDSPDQGLMKTVDIPLDMRVVPDGNRAANSPDPTTGWSRWQETDDQGVESDVNMRNKGYMRGPLYYTIGRGGSDLARTNHEDLRRIITRAEFKQGEHWLRFKNVLKNANTAEFHLDYIEFCPENVYDNPDYAEDMY